uniref:Protein phosphatase n=1 Tax=Kalmanozyma brasiliensis (strain GHG001) TaxID=1365824 RepID=V5GI75_KALBG
MSKFPNHGLFTRTASASSRSTSLIAHARRAQQDSSGSHGSGSSTPTQNNSLSPYQIESALLGPTSILTTAARGNYDQRRSASAAAATDSADASDASPLWTSSFASPKHRRLQYCFEHGAYGIPKRHPWAAVRGNGKRVQPAPPKPAARSGAVGMLAAAADFLTGSAAPSGPAAAKEKLGGDAVLAEDGRRLGLNSPIREHGRIVQDRLQSVQVGEDAYFLRPDSIGVADGVGGWASRAGADPALFSRLLMHFCAAELSKFDGLSADELAAQGGKKLQEWEQLDPVEVMHIAWERCVRASRREGILGSSTALLAVLRGDELRIANLGDCVLLIIRAGELLFRSTEQQHSFNFPVQLGMMGHTAESVTIAANRTLHRDGFLQSGASDDLDDNAPNPLGSTTPASLDEARKGIPGASSASDDGDVEEAEWDEPRRDAGRWAVKVQKGDIIIVGSDGLVDNLFDEDIVEEVLRFAPPRSSHQSIPDDDDASLDSGDRPIEGQDEYRLPDDFCPQLVSEALCSRAKAVSEDSRAVSSPFQQRAMEEGLHYVGGKHDDISVVVAVVGDPSERLTKASYSIRSEPEGDSETRSASGSA